MAKKNIDLISKALGAAESSIRLAKQLLAEMEGVNGVQTTKDKLEELPGITGIFDGENMVAGDGQTFPVPANYASKSMLVVGDTLKLVEEGKEKRFKQIEHVKRHKTSGMLTKKDGKWKVITPEGSYKVLPASVSHFGADVGSEVLLHLPANKLTVPYGAIESIKAAGGEQKQAPTKVEEAPMPTPVISPKVTQEKNPEKIVQSVPPAAKEKAPDKEKEEKKPEVKEPKEVVKAEVKPEPVAKVVSAPAPKLEATKETPKETAPAAVPPVTGGEEELT